MCTGGSNACNGMPTSLVLVEDYAGMKQRLRVDGNTRWSFIDQKEVVRGKGFQDSQYAGTGGNVEPAVSGWFFYSLILESHIWSHDFLPKTYFAHG